MNSFNKLRLLFFAIFIVGAGVVLGMTASLNSRLSTTDLHDFLIFSFVVSILTIVVLLLLVQRSQPRIDAVVLFILAVLWLTMGAYSQDIIGHQLCYGLKGQTIPAKNNTTMSAESYCRQMKTILAFSWANFVFHTIWFLWLLNVVSKLSQRDRDIWGASISEVDFPENSDSRQEKYTYTYPTTSHTSLPQPGQTHVYYPSSPYPSSGRHQPQIIQQQPGHSVIIRGGQGKEALTVRCFLVFKVIPLWSNHHPDLCLVVRASPSPDPDRPLQRAMRSEELIRWTTMGISCAIGVQLLLFVIPSLRPYGTIIQVLLALGACGGLAYVAATDRRQNGNLTAEGHNRNELKMIGMFFILWLMFAIMFRMTGVGGAGGHSSTPAAAAPSSTDTHRNHDRQRPGDDMTGHHVRVVSLAARQPEPKYRACDNPLLSLPPASPTHYHQLSLVAEPCGPFAHTNATCFSPTHTSPKRRIETDVMKMLMSDYKVSLVNDNMQEFYVMFNGPEETAFAGGVWKIHVELPDQYPYKSPSIGFMNKIFHPNIDELSGSVCLDVINQTWSPMFDMINIFESFLPQLLRYPNPSDPLNGEAAALLMREPKNYEAKVREYVKRYASKEAAEAAAATEEEEEDDEDAEMSSVGSISEDEGNA
ncbi:hypothetical protein OPQ81_004334 [Rhizoctonia solani]|nr:hypothetical protein OPQ81_004334 [Rhizoctonia solani]